MSMVKSSKAIDEERKKREAYLQARLSGKNKTQSLADAGYQKTSRGSEVEEGKSFKELVNDVIGKEKLARVLDAGLDANLTVYDKENGEMKESSVADYSTRHKYLETALKVTGDIGRDGVNIHADGNINILAQIVDAGVRGRTV